MATPGETALGANAMAVDPSEKENVPPFGMPTLPFKRAVSASGEGQTTGKRRGGPTTV